MPPPPPPPNRTVWAWLIVTSSLLLVLEVVLFARGRATLTNLLIPIGLVSLAVGQVATAQRARNLLQTTGIVIMLIALWLRFRA
jgi:predicted membrane-bound dolichyl-phosphate-mannose-protein mannosyltransferase